MKGHVTGNANTDWLSDDFKDYCEFFRCNNPYISEIHRDIFWGKIIYLGFATK